MKGGNLTMIVGSDYIFQSLDIPSHISFFICKIHGFKWLGVGNTL
jgi:hypothetical protein